MSDNSHSFVRKEVRDNGEDINLREEVRRLRENEIKKIEYWRK